MRALGQSVAIAIAAAVALVWGAAAVLAFAFRFSQHTDDGPMCFHGTPAFAVAQALVAALGIAALLAATWIGTSTTGAGYRSRLRPSIAAALLAAATWIASVTVWLPSNPTSPGAC